MYSDGHVAVHLREQLIHSDIGRLTERRNDLCFAIHPVLDRLADDCSGLGHQEPMAGCQPKQLLLQQGAERLQVAGHVAVGRVNDDCRALNQMITSDQYTLFFQ